MLENAKGFVCVNGKMYESFSSKVIYIPAYANVGISLRAFDPNRKITVHRFSIAEAQFRPIINRFDLGAIGQSNNGDAFPITHYFQTAHDIAHVKDNPCAIYAVFCSALLAYLYTLSSKELISIAAFPNDVDRLVHHIRADITRKWNVDNLAESVDMTLSQLHRTLTKENITFSQLLNIIRLKYSLRFLYAGEPIKQCAQLSGFDGSNYYSTVFKKYYGVNPSKIKQHNDIALLHPPISNEQLDIDTLIFGDP
jgi:AraC-like DNA-binding protein